MTARDLIDLELTLLGGLGVWLYQWESCPQDNSIDKIPNRHLHVFSSEPLFETSDSTNKIIRM